MGLLNDIKTLLTSVDTTYCYIGDMPDYPDNLIALYNTGGIDPDKTMSSGKYEKPTFQIRVRSTTYAAGITKCEAIKDILALISNQTINAHFYLAIRQQGDILSIGKDDSNRNEFTLNFQCELIR